MTKLKLFTPTKSASHRQKKVAEELRFYLSQEIERGNLPGVRHPDTSEFFYFSTPITITAVTVSADLKNATIHIMPLGGIQQEEALLFMNLQAGYLRKVIASKLRLRGAPRLHFSLDESFDYADHILGVLNQHKISEDSDN